MVQDVVTVCKNQQPHTNVGDDPQRSTVSDGSTPWDVQSPAAVEFCELGLKKKTLGLKGGLEAEPPDPVTIQWGRLCGHCLMAPAGRRRIIPPLYFLFLMDPLLALAQKIAPKPAHVIPLQWCDHIRAAASPERGVGCRSSHVLGV